MEETRLRLCFSVAATRALDRVEGKLNTALLSNVFNEGLAQSVRNLRLGQGSPQPRQHRSDLATTL